MLIIQPHSYAFINVTQAAVITETKPSNDVSSTMVLISFYSDLSVTKDDGAVLAIPGTTVAYTITATNNVRRPVD